MDGITRILLALICWFFSLLASIFELFNTGNAIPMILIIVLTIAYYYLVFKNTRAREEKAYTKLTDTLMQDEAIIEKGIDKRPYALFSRRQVFAITNSRVIRLERPFLGGFKMLDFQWKDLQDVQVSENAFSRICGSTLTFIFGYDGEDYTGIEVYPDVKIASKAYKQAQLEEQAWEEKRRVREMEETRAQSGGVMIGQGVVPSTIASNQSVQQDNQTKGNPTNISDELIKLKKLLDDGILSDSEFQEMKSKILSRNTQNF